MDEHIFSSTHYRVLPSPTAKLLLSHIKVPCAHGSVWKLCLIFHEKVYSLQCQYHAVLITKASKEVPLSVKWVSPSYPPSSGMSSLPVAHYSTRWILANSTKKICWGFCIESNLGRYNFVGFFLFVFLFYLVLGLNAWLLAIRHPDVGKSMTLLFQTLN